jgi:hypothetical protein
MESKPHQTGRQLVRGKGIPANMRIEQPVSLVDIVPTILSQAGVRPPADLDGRDLSPLWRGEQIDEFEHRTMFAEGAGGVTWQLIAPGSIPSTARFAGAGTR